MGPGQTLFWDDLFFITVTWQLLIGAKQRKMSKGAHSAAAYRVEDEDGGELTEAVQSHVSEETEGGDQRTSTLSVQK